MSENGEIYTADKNLTLPPAVTAVTNSTSGWELKKYLPNLSTPNTNISQGTKDSETPRNMNIQDHHCHLLSAVVKLSKNCDLISSSCRRPCWHQACVHKTIVTLLPSCQKLFPIYCVVHSAQVQQYQPLALVIPINSFMQLLSLKSAFFLCGTSGSHQINVNQEGFVNSCLIM